MVKEYDTYSAMFKSIEKDIDRSLKTVSIQLVEIWKQLVEDNFYGMYNPTKIYPRTWQSLDAIMTLGFKNNTVYIGYNTSVIKRFTYGDRNQYVGHGDIEKQPSFVEDGFTMRSGEKREGAHAFEDMLKYIHSDAFVALFNAEMKKLGYSVTYK